MKLKNLAAVILAASTALLCGCNIADLSFEESLRPPRTMGDEAEIEKLISKTAGSNYTLKYPKSGSYRSAIIMNDLNGDGVDEAIAFFKGKDETAGVHMLLMYDQDGEWKTYLHSERELFGVLHLLKRRDRHNSGRSKLLVVLLRKP